MYETRSISPGLMRSDGEVRELHNEAKTHPPQSSVLELSLGTMNAVLCFKSC